MTASAKSSSRLTAQIRLATATDAQRMIPLINAAYSVETFIDGTRTDEDRLAAMMEKGVILLAEDGSGQLLGCVYTEVRGSRGYLGQLAVDRARQGEGLGRLMVEAAEEHLRRQGCEALDITVLSLRPELPPLYRRLGFVETGTEEFVHPIPLKAGFECHCVVMSKQL
jgi:ribosomal protein S18 acetylase RimI-like enzyme